MTQYASVDLQDEDSIASWCSEDLQTRETRDTIQRQVKVFSTCSTLQVCGVESCRPLPRGLQPAKQNGRNPASKMIQDVFSRVFGTSVQSLLGAWQLARGHMSLPHFELQKEERERVFSFPFDNGRAFTIDMVLRCNRKAACCFHLLHLLFSSCCRFAVKSCA